MSSTLGKFLTICKDIFTLQSAKVRMLKKGGKALNRIRELRKKKGITMKALGEAIGVAESTISLYETEKRMPDTDTLKQLAHYFNVSIDVLLGESAPVTVSDADIKFALFGGDKEITDEQFEEVKRFAQYVKEREEREASDKR